jgi:hypothetical protein
MFLATKINSQTRQTSTALGRNLECEAYDRRLFNDLQLRIQYPTFENLSTFNLTKWTLQNLHEV